MIRNLTRDLRVAALAALAASIAVLGGAFAFQYIGGLAPCVLCIYQRYVYGVTIALSTVAVALAFAPHAAMSRQTLLRALMALCGAAFVVGAGIAFFHVGVEHHWWEGTAECTGTAGAAGSLEQMEAMLKAAPVVRCDEVAWSLFGVSMAGYNVLISLALACLSFLAAVKGRDA